MSKLRYFFFYNPGNPKKPWPYLGYFGECTPVFVVEDDSRILEPSQHDLNGSELIDWLKANPTAITYKKKVPEPPKGPPKTKEKIMKEMQAKGIGAVFPKYIDIDSPYYQPGWILHESPVPDGDYLHISSDKKDSEFISNFQEFEAIEKRLMDSFRVVSPSNSASSVFGSLYREIILLSSMEVEIHWTHFLKINGLLKERYNTNDYVKLKKFINSPKMTYLWSPS